MKKIPRSLPVAPMIPWIKERVERETTDVFAQRLGINDRRIREVLSGRSKVLTFDIIDRMITNDGTVNFCDFYPEYDDDEKFFSINEDSNYDAPMIRPKTICSIEECEEVIHAKGLCNKHYRAWRKQTVVA